MKQLCWIDERIKIREIGVNYELVGLVWNDWLSMQLYMKWLWTIGASMNS